MKKYSLFIILFNLLVLLVYFNYSIAQKESLLKNGQLVLLELAPVDPRSLMQGDYMALRYAISEGRHEIGDIPKRGYCVVKLTNGVAERVRFQADKLPLHSGEYLIVYTSPNQWNINIGAESYFFEEGQGNKFEAAKYGGVMVDGNGNSLLVGLYDEHRKKIE